MTGERTQRRRVSEWVAARSVRQLVLAAGAVVLLLSGAFGGLRQAEPDQPTRLVTDQSHRSTPFDLTVKRVVWSDDLGEALGPSEFGRYLVVFADVSTQEDRSVRAAVLQEAVRFEGLEGFRKSQFGAEAVHSEEPLPRIVVTADQVELSELGPGLTYEVAFIWEQRTSEPLPTDVNLVTRSQQFRQSSLEETSDWFDASDDAAGRFALTELGAS